jgi:hypothetical protein
LPRTFEEGDGDIVINSIEETSKPIEKRATRWQKCDLKAREAAE